MERLVTVLSKINGLWQDPHNLQNNLQINPQNHPKRLEFFLAGQPRPPGHVLPPRRAPRGDGPSPVPLNPIQATQQVAASPPVSGLPLAACIQILT